MPLQFGSVGCGTSRCKMRSVQRTRQPPPTPPRLQPKRYTYRPLVHTCVYKSDTQYSTGDPPTIHTLKDQTRQDGKSKRRWAVTDESMIVTGGEGCDQKLVENGDVRRCHRHGNCYCLGTGWRRFGLILAGKLFHAAEFGHAAELFTAEFGHELGHAGAPLVPALVFMW